MRRLTIAAALLFAALSHPALAQSRSEHDHQPGSDQVPAPTQTTPPTGRSGERQGMMGSGDMMARGMMARGAAGEHAMGPPMVFRVVFALMDADGDGTVSLAEFQAAHERIFKAMDSNKDGKLSPEEMQAFMHGTGK